MRRLRKLRRLPAAERRLLLEAALLVTATRITLSVLPFVVVRRLGQYLQVRAGRPRPGGPPAQRVAWAVAAAARYVPGATCLTQALAAQTLLARAGYDAQLRIGVAPGANRDAIVAHAWVESGGRVVIGGAVERYRPIAPSPEHAP